MQRASHFIAIMHNAQKEYPSLPSSVNYSCNRQSSARTKYTSTIICCLLLRG